MSVKRPPVSSKGDCRRSGLPPDDVRDEAPQAQQDEELSESSTSCRSVGSGKIRESGFGELSPHVAFPAYDPRRPRKDKVKDKAINAAYRQSKRLRNADVRLRARWSIVREERLAAVFGTYVRGEEVFKIDLPSIVNVDEWLECAAHLAEAQEANDGARAREIGAEMAWIEEATSSYPSHSIFGVICKLMIWRRKNGGLLQSENEEGKRHRLAYAAYADLLRLTGFLSVACEEDRAGGIF